MIKAYENELRSVADRLAEAEREARRIVGKAKGREENYTQVLRTKIEEKLNGFSEGGISWKVVTYTPEKQSGEETDRILAYGSLIDAPATEIRDTTFPPSAKGRMSPLALRSKAAVRPPKNT